MRLHDSILNDKGTGCEVPQLDPFSEDTLKDYYGMAKLKCEGVEWVECNLSKCYVVEEFLKKMKKISCIYKDIIYIDDDKYKIGRSVKLYGNETYILTKSDHVKVSCTGVEIGALLPTRWYGYKVGFRNSTSTHNIEQPRGRYSACKNLNVMILCFKAASRNRFLRRMPKSHNALKELDALFYNIHSIVGDGTEAALIPLMTGKSETELPDMRKETSMELIDEKKFIFHLAKENGYRTAFFEDTEYIGTFQNRYNGFKRQPADHYLRAFHLETMRNHKWLISYKKNMHCVGSIPLYKQLLNLTLQIPKLKSKYFCFTLIGQIYNDPYNLIPTVDDDMAEFLGNLKSSGSLRNTLLMVLGDHGPRFGEFRNTYQGKLEERLPLMALVLPKGFKKCRPKIAAAVEANTKILTTHFDAHATVLDAMGLEDHINAFKVFGASVPRGMSLLRSIPKNRTCGEAGVLPHWCVCFKWSNVPKHDPMFYTVATVLTEFINNLTVVVRDQCTERKLTSVVWVMRQSPNEDVLRHERDNKGITSYLAYGRVMRPSKEYYQTKVKMSPGEAVFESTLTYLVDRSAFELRKTEISRVSSYGEESFCIRDTHPSLLGYCYCNRKSKSTFSYKTLRINKD
ncbi:unnamed protein product [Diatraea saccharalis]|uniref:DUF229 domain containing protein n=1 Tax=Diatraea saccharalis TaxID=40085 RepID=A0A9N9QPI6_9NEOP|nr:unnamed protein product [Diatraea saccharalis]